MANPEEVKRAKSLLRPQQWLWGDPGGRMHETGLEVAYTLYQALKHPCCGMCAKLNVHDVFIDGKQSVYLTCDIKDDDHDPQKLWSGWTPDKLPITCLDCTDPAGQPPAEELEVE